MNLIATPMTSSTHFDLVSQWRIHAPVDRVWAALTDPASWPQWWPYVREVRTLREGSGPDGLGTVRRIDWATRLPYRISIEVESVEVVRHQRLRGLSRGQLDGEGLWLLRAQPCYTEVTYVWRVTLQRPWMRRLAPLLASVFRWNHDGVMRAGEVGLRRLLEEAPSTTAGIERARCVMPRDYGCEPAPASRSQCNGWPHPEGSASGPAPFNRRADKVIAQGGDQHGHTGFLQAWRDG